MANVLINEISIKRKIDEALKASRYEALARNAANTRFVAARQTLLEEYDEHPVTKEIAEGPEAKGDILPGPGNLFSFLGFFAGTHPEQDLRKYLRSNINMLPRAEFAPTDRRFKYQFDVTAPTLQELYDATPPTENFPSTSWLKSIEKGVGSFAEYVYSLTAFKKVKQSKSKTALQIRTKNQGGREDKVLGIKYVSEMLETFEDKFDKK